MPRRTSFSRGAMCRWLPDPGLREDKRSWQPHPEHRLPIRSIRNRRLRARPIRYLLPRQPRPKSRRRSPVSTSPTAAPKSGRLPIERFSGEHGTCQQLADGFRVSRGVETAASSNKAKLTSAKFGPMPTARQIQPVSDLALASADSCRSDAIRRASFRRNTIASP